ncbi:hypothetical protein MUK42_36264 [Musa troglodytarum]|uniref:Uncharacterized protein n=1 Tax=Musa troglodytarum TaxID=320322 RepID=A0A9E7EC65_9LILI|nr:hypothetical protein MUK42_36264 [Musa troglodytarum]
MPVKAVYAVLNNLLYNVEVAAQEAKCAEFIVEKAEQDKNSAVIRVSSISQLS